MINFDNDYWFCIYLDDDDDYVEFTIKSLVKEELDKLSKVVKELGDSDDEIQEMKEEFIDALIYNLTSLKHSERMIHFRRKRLNGHSASCATKWHRCALSLPCNQILMRMALSDLLLKKASQPGLWFVKSKYTSLDISRLVYDLAVVGSMFLEIYTPDKGRIISTVISMIIKDSLSNAIDPIEHFYVEDDISDYYEHGSFWMLPELNEYLPNGVFWDQQVWIYDYDPLFIHNCSFETIIIDDINGLHDNYYKYNEESRVNLLQQTEKLAIQEGKSVFVFVRDITSNLTNDFMRKRLIN